HLNPIRAKALPPDQRRQLLDRNEFAAAELFDLEVKRTIMCDVVDHAERDRIIAVVANWKDAQRLDLDAQFLAPFPPRGVVERFTSGHAPADGQIPVRGKHVLGRRSLMDEEFAAGVEDEEVDATVRKAPAAHVAPGDAADDLTGI